LKIPYGDNEVLAPSGHKRTFNSNLSTIPQLKSEKLIDTLTLPIGTAHGIGGGAGSGKSTLILDFLFHPQWKNDVDLQNIKRIYIKSSEAVRETNDFMQKLVVENIDFYDFAMITPAQLQMIIEYYRHKGIRIWIFLDSFAGASAIKPFIGFQEQTIETGWSTNSTANNKLISNFAGPDCTITLTYPFGGKTQQSTTVIWSFFNAGYNVALYLDRNGHLSDVRYASEGIGPFIVPTLDGEVSSTSTGASPNDFLSQTEESSGFRREVYPDDFDFDENGG
jgi:hypothetical protein